MKSATAVLGLLLGICLLIPLVSARTPSAIVVAVDELAVRETLAKCKGVVIRENEIFISKQIGDFVREKLMTHPNIYVEPDLNQTEDITNIVLYRSARICKLFLAKQKLSPLDGTFAQVIKGKIHWSVQHNDDLHLSGETQSFTIKPGTQQRVGTYGNTPAKSATSISIHNYGRLALWENSPNKSLSCTTDVKRNGSAYYRVSLRLTNESIEALTVNMLDIGTIRCHKGKEFLNNAGDCS